MTKLRSGQPSDQRAQYRQLTCDFAFAPWICRFVVLYGAAATSVKLPSESTFRCASSKRCNISCLLGKCGICERSLFITLIVSMKARNDAVERLTKFAGAVSAVVLAIGALMIFTTMMASVVERTKEIGVLRAIGFRRMHIIKGFMIEAVLISAAGGVLGWAAGITASWLALPYFTETGAGLVSATGQSLQRALTSITLNSSVRQLYATSASASVPWKSQRRQGRPVSLQSGLRRAVWAQPRSTACDNECRGSAGRLPS